MPAARNIEDMYPLTPMQQGMLFQALYAPGTGVYVQQVSARLTGRLDPRLFRRTWEALVERHPALRTAFDWERRADPFQIVYRHIDLPWTDHDWSAHDEPTQARMLEQLLAVDRARGFPLDRGPLLRVALVRLAPDRWQVLWSHHHLILDGWSVPLLLEDLFALYRRALGDAAALPPARRPFREYVAWLRRQDRDAARSFWHRELAGLERRTTLAVRRGAGGANERFIGPLAHEGLRLPRADTDAATAWARANGLTLSTLVQGAWAAVLGRFSNAADVLYGVTVAGRPPELTGADRMVGLFINTVPARVALPPAIPAVGRLQALQLRQSQARSFEHAPLVEALSAPAGAGARATLDSVFVFENYPAVSAGGTGLSDLTLEGADAIEQTNLPLTVVAVPGTQLLLEIDFDEGRFDAAFVQALLHGMRDVLRGVVATPTAPLAVLLGTVGQSDGLSITRDDTRPRWPVPLVHELIDHQAAAHPGDPAIVADGAAVSFRALRARTDAVAGALRARGVGLEDRVGVELPRSPELLVALLGVLKAGAAYVPLERAHPTARAAHIAADAGVSFVIGNGTIEPERYPYAAIVSIDDLERASPPIDLPVVDDRTLAYVLYTSGSTGTPKGVAVTHRGFTNYVCWAVDAYDVAGGRGAPLHSTVGVDLTVTSIFPPLAAGRPVHIVPEADRLTGLAAALHPTAPTTRGGGPGLHPTAPTTRGGGPGLHPTAPTTRGGGPGLHPTAPTTRGGGPGLSVRPDFSLVKIAPAHLGLLDAILPEGAGCDATRAFVIGGEALTYEQLQPWRRRNPRARLINEYGPTETVVGCTIYDAAQHVGGGGAVPIGRPIANTSVYVLDRTLSAAPIGVAGELFIGGDGVARGYHARADLTAERFVPDPFAGEPGARMYRTGDLGSLRPDGQLEFHGRVDGQVKIRGYRVELGEIESALSSHEQVRDAVVLATGEHNGSDRRLAAYVTPRPDRRPRVSDLRAHLQARLPDYMVPSAFVVLERLPLTPHGKIDRGALPAATVERPADEVAFEEPRPGAERILADVWEEALGVARIGRHDNFFALGGDSIRSLKVLARARNRGIDVALPALFQHQTIAAIVAAGFPVPAPDAVTAAAPRLALLDEHDRAALAARGGAIEDAYPLTRAQQGMLFHSAFTNASTMYHNVSSFRLRIRFGEAPFRAAVSRLVARHPVLRTSLHPAGFAQPLQIVHRSVAAPVTVEDLRTLPEPQQSNEINAFLQRERHRRFDWTQAPVFALSVHRRRDDEIQLTLSEHHAILDGWSVATMLSELMTDYLGAIGIVEPAALEPPRARFADGVRLERQALADDAMLRFWCERLDGTAPAPLPLFGREPNPGATGIRVHETSLDADVGFALATVAQRARVPFRSALLAAHAFVVSLLDSNSDVVTGLVVNTRPELPDGDRVLGLFLNTVPLRVDVGAASWRDLLARVFEAERALLPYRAFPMADLRRALGGAPLFHCVFNYGHFHVYDRLARIGGLDVLESREWGEHEFPLAASFSRDVATGAVRLSLKCGAPLDAGVLERVSAWYARTIEAIARTPDGCCRTFSPLAGSERAVLHGWARSSRVASHALATHERIAIQARWQPDTVAVVLDNRRLTYAELDRQSTDLAGSLRALGVGPEACVALHGPASPDLVVAMLAVWKAGGAFVPLDPSYPADRIRFILEEAAPVVVFDPRSGSIQTRLRTAGARGAATLEPGPVEALDQLAYVIYTSGSTGMPKGVMLTHRGVRSLIDAEIPRLELTAASRVLQFASTGFDVAIWEIFPTLVAGGRLVLASRDDLRVPDQVHRLLRDHAITTVTLPPSLLAVLSADGLPALATVVSAADVCREDVVRRWSIGRRLLNAYGPTEITVCATMTGALAVSDGRPPIGRPLDNCDLWVLTPFLDLAPLGVAGELCIGGDGVARGYLGRPDLTAERFVPHPWSETPGARLYRTGDLVRWRDDGQIEFLGRRDHQVKIRGYRVELGEIEAALHTCPGVAEAVVLIRAHDSDDVRLVAYLRRAPDAALDGAAPRAALAGRLPEYMIPARFVVLDDFPRLPSGKPDRVRMPHSADERPDLREVLDAPAGDLEDTVAAVWREVLKVDRVGANDNFFDIGGHSLLAVQLAATLRETLGRELPIVDLFAYPTVRALARHLAGDGSATAGHAPASADVVEQGPRAFAASPDIAIVGMAGRFPGAPTVDAFWRNLASGVESISSFSDEEAIASGADPSLVRDPRYVKAGGVLEGSEWFDASFFGYTPREAAVTDPQQRVFLECAWEALEDAGYDSARYRRPIGVYAGMSANTYLLSNLISRPRTVEAMGLVQTAIANLHDHLATRVSYKLDLRGPSFTVQTACSTSLVAVHVACRALVSGECDMALAGGVSIGVAQKAGYLHVDGGIQSPDGHCRAFDADANGVVGGSGVGVIVLKRLADALANGDRVIAVVKGTAINNDGASKVGYTAPSVEGQAEVISRALQTAGVDPSTIGYIEAHGTGTAIGDPIEVEALARVFRRSPGVAIGLGSVKTNVGHLDAAAGVAGLIKTVLALAHRQIPPSLHFKRPNPHIDFTATPFLVVDRLRDWAASTVPRRAGVSSFGIGGTNAHVVLEEAPPVVTIEDEDEPQLYSLSARTPAALQEARSRLAEHLEARPDLSPGNTAWTLQVGRRAFPVRLAVAARSHHEAIERLRAASAPTIETAVDRPPPCAFLFPGQGSQYPRMAHALAGRYPRFRDALARCAAAMTPALEVDLRALLEDDSDDAVHRLQQTQYAQPALFAVEYALARLLMDAGVAPAGLLGHSVGELVAACLSGVFTLEDAASLVAERGRLMRDAPRGAMLAVMLEEAEAHAWVTADISLAAVNGPRACVLSGSVDRLAGDRGRPRIGAHRPGAADGERDPHGGDTADGGGGCRGRRGVPRRDRAPVDRGRRDRLAAAARRAAAAPRGAANLPVRAEATLD